MNGLWSTEELDVMCEPTEAEFRRVMGVVPTSVAVVAGLADDGRPVGLSIGTLISVSLAPPLVAFCPSRTSTSWPVIRPLGRFSVNVLSAGQHEVSATFARTGADKFATVSWEVSDDGLPVLVGSVAMLGCTLVDEHEAGDHTIVVGRVRSCEATGIEDSLLFRGGSYGAFG